MELAMVTGAATAKGGQIDLYLVLYRDGQIERAKEFTVKNDDEQIANSMNGIVRELLSGQSPVAEEEQSVIGGDIVADADMFGDEEMTILMISVPPVAGFPRQEWARKTWTILI